MLLELCFCVHTGGFEFSWDDSENSGFRTEYQLDSCEGVGVMSGFIFIR